MVIADTRPGSLQTMSPLAVSHTDAQLCRPHVSTRSPLGNTSTPRTRGLKSLESSSPDSASRMKHTPSSLQVTTRSPLGKIWAHFTCLRCSKTCTDLPEAVSHILAVVSRLHVRARSPNGKNCTPATSAVWPRSTRRGPRAPQIVTISCRMLQDAIWKRNPMRSKTCRMTSLDKTSRILCIARSALNSTTESRRLAGLAA
mmetsp:Transcript_33232/g.94514  ORF Transcript_33232/g.94514 Transcript_33232/m.94514 type:complete len:200 (+) Transcript_33232:599-1198(+)